VSEHEHTEPEPDERGETDDGEELPDVAQPEREEDEARDG
jgi:hypothetical protein